VVLRSSSSKDDLSTYSKFKVIVALVVLAVIVILHSISTNHSKVNEVLMLLFLIVFSLSIIITLIVFDRALGL